MASSPETSCNSSSGYRHRIRYRVRHPIRELLRQTEHRFAVKIARVLGVLAVDSRFVRPMTAFQLKRAFREAVRLQSWEPIVRALFDWRQLLLMATAENSLRLIRPIEHFLAASLETILRREHAKREFVRVLTARQLKNLWGADPLDILGVCLDLEKLRVAAREERRRATEKLSRMDYQEPEGLGDESCVEKAVDVDGSRARSG